MSIRVTRCDSPIKAVPLTVMPRRGSNPVVMSQKKTTTVVRRPTNRPDMDMEIQRTAVKAEKLQSKQQWLQSLCAPPNMEHQVASIKYAVAESMIYHHKNGSRALCSMLDNEADKKGTAKSEAAAAKKNQQATCCGLPKHYLSVLMDDVELITKLDGSKAALNSIRALPLWKLASQ